MEKIQRNKEILGFARRRFPFKVLADRYGVTVAAISAIAKREEKKEQLKLVWKDLPIRVVNTLLKHNIHSLEETRKLSDEYLLKIKNINKVSLKLIRGVV